MIIIRIKLRLECNLAYDVYDEVAWKIKWYQRFMVPHYHISRKMKQNGSLLNKVAALDLMLVFGKFWPKLSFGI